MSKQKIITIIIVVIILSIGISLFVYGKLSKKEIVNIDTNLPLIENKDKIEGNKDDLISFSIWPDTKVSGIVSFIGVVKGGYFFEGNILINILDSNKNVLRNSNAMAKTDWMTADPVEFEGYIDFTTLPKGPAYFEIHNDNASGLPENDKSIIIPIIIS